MARGLPWLTQLMVFAFVLASLSGLHAKAASPAFRKTTYMYKAVGETKIQADVYRLNDKKVRPVLVWIHGGAFVLGSRHSVQPELGLLDLCRADGSIFVSIDYRLAPEVKLPEIIEDLKDAFHWVRAKGPALFQADPRRLVVAGGSAGGYLTLMSGLCVEPRPLALVSYWGYGDVDEAWLSQPSDYYRKHAPAVTKEEAYKAVGRKVITEAEGDVATARGGKYSLYLRQNGLFTKEITGLDLKADRAKLDALCPVRNISSKYPPVLMIHGTADTDVPYEKSVAMAAALARHNVPHELITVPRGGHGLGGVDKRVVAECNERAKSFIREHMEDGEVLDLSLPVAPDLPCTWPADWWPLFQINHYQRIGPLSAYNSDILTIDGNTGTQLDFPPHNIPPPDSGLPNAGPLGKMFSDKVPAWQFCGEACVIDCQALLDSAPKGRSDLITKEHVMAWEKKHRPVGPGDVVLFASGYSDRYYKPFPAGRRFLADPLDGKAPAWPDPDPGCMEFLGSRKVMTLGCDSPTMGPIPDLAAETHLAGLKHGMIWTEAATGLGRLPVTGAFYCCVGPKHVGDPYGEGRAFAVVAQPLAKRLIEAARKKNVVDLSVPLSPDLPVWWPGAGTGNNRQPYQMVPFTNYRAPHFVQRTHTMDSHTGTHLVPPAYALPAAGFDNQSYAREVREWLTEYEAKYGPRGVSDVTADKVPPGWTCGPARVIDVKHLVGTTDKARWPASPEITVAEIKAYEQKHGALRPREVVIFHSGYSDAYLKPFPQGNRCLLEPLNGKVEGWPALGPDAAFHLAEKGIRCVATDSPTLGGVDPRRALWTYWALGGKNMVGVEYLMNVGKLGGEAYFLFAAVKVRGCHGGPGRALAVTF